MRKYILTAVLLPLMCMLVQAQEFNTKKLDSLFDILETNDKFMGSIAISRDGEELYARAIGYADIESGLKATTATKYRIGSISKMFTSVLILKAVEEGKLSLDTTLATYFPDIENADSISMTNLLNHSSGIFNFTNSPDYLAWNTQPKSRDDLLKIIKEGGIVFKPNEKTDYSNANFVLLTFILEDLHNKSYKDLVEEQITTPLGLHATYLGSKIKLSASECNSYTFRGEWAKENETDMSIPLGAGAMVSKPSDLNTFIESIFNGSLISEKSLEQMLTLKNGLGLGIFQFPFKNKSSYGHGGGIDGFSSFLGYLVDDKIAVALTSNGTIYENNEILRPAVSAALGEPFELPVFTEIELTSEEMDPYLGVYASTQLPLKITITKTEKSLIAQATGQSSFPVTCTAKDVFKFTPAGVVLEFVPEKNQMTLKQGGGEFLFTKE